MGETRVDLQHLLEDLRDAYPGALEETILTEVIANALDSGATRVELSTEPELARITIVDDGAGMSRRLLRRYHDVAASTKSRGQGIGFAGVGIKLGLLLSDEVITETRCGAGAVATSWRLASRQRAPWRWVPPPGRVRERGTAVSLRLQNPLSPLLDGGFVSATIQRHFAPLLDAHFAQILAPRYAQGVRFVVNGAPVIALPVLQERVPVALRIGRKQKPGAVGYLLRAVAPLPQEQQGIAVSALGKIIKQGWDWLGLNPIAPDRISGLIEVPALAECLTLNKADFLRSGARGATYLLYRRALQEAVSAQLAIWGAENAERDDARMRRRARPLERDLQTVLVDLADEFPMLASLVERQPGGQKNLPAGKPVPGANPSIAVTVEPPLPVMPDDGVMPPDPVEPVMPGLPPPERRQKTGGQGGARRPARYGLSIQFEQRADDLKLGRLAESTVWVNEAHPAYQRALASRSEGYHVAVTVALVLAPLAVEPAQMHAFISAFLTHWGEVLSGNRGRRK